jgi:hypothetical protein
VNVREMNATYDAHGLITHWPAQVRTPAAYEPWPDNHRAFGWEHWAIVACVIGAALALIVAAAS